MILLDNNKNVPLYEQLFRELRKAIINGELESNRKLDPIRIMAEKLGVSRNTVSKAYQQLLTEGYVRATQGSGYYVEPLREIIEAEEYNGREQNRKAYDWMKENTVTFSGKSSSSMSPFSIKYDFSYERFESDLFPWGKWRSYLNKAITENSYAESISYENNKGNMQFRKSICEYVRQKRGLVCSPEQIIICSGTQYAMDILMTILPKRTYKIAVEEPGYDGMRQVFLNHGAEICPIPMTKAGIDVNMLETTDCNLVYICPSHQFPTGATIPLMKRIQILQWAHRNQTYIIENDYDNEFLYGDHMLATMQSMDKNDNVIYMSTMAKILSPEIRCAFMILPYSLLKSYEIKYQYHYSSRSRYEQQALTDFINDGNLDRQERKIHTINRKKRELVLTGLKKHLRGIVSCSEFTAGTHLLIKIKTDMPQEEMLLRLEKYQIRLYGTGQYWYHPQNADPGLYLLGYNAIPVDRIEEAVRNLAQAVREILEL